MLANKFCDLAEGYENRELLAAAAVFISCTIKARYFRREWEKATDSYKPLTSVFIARK